MGTEPNLGAWRRLMGEVVLDLGLKPGEESWERNTGRRNNMSEARKTKRAWWNCQQVTIRMSHNIGRALMAY